MTRNFPNLKSESKYNAEELSQMLRNTTEDPNILSRYYEFKGARGIVVG
jgi:hypothetical protein